LAGVEPASRADPAPAAVTRAEAKSAIGRPVMSQLKPVKVAFGQPKGAPAFQY
jgi:hypothetical protein